MALAAPELTCANSRHWEPAPQTDIPRTGRSVCSGPPHRSPDACSLWPASAARSARQTGSSQPPCDRSAVSSDTITSIVSRSDCFKKARLTSR